VSSGNLLLVSHILLKTKTQTSATHKCAFLKSTHIKKKERDAHLAELEEELKIVREKDEYIKKQKKNNMHIVLGRVTHMLRGVLE